MKLRHVSSVIILVLISFAKEAGSQDLCYKMLIEQGNAALEREAFQEAIKSFQSIIRNCDKASEIERDKAIALLDTAYQRSERTLKQSTIAAEENARKAAESAEKAKREAHLKNLEAIRARASKMALHAKEEEDSTAKLALAYHSKRLMDTLPNARSSIAVFGEAVKLKYSLTHQSDLGYINDAVMIGHERLAVASAQELTIIDSDTSKSIEAHNDHILSLRPYRDGIVTTSKDGGAKYWDAGGHFVFELTGHNGDVHDAIISQGEDRIITISKDGNSILWNDGGLLIDSLSSGFSNIHDGSFSADGQLFFIRSQDKIVSIWDLQSRTSINLRHSTHVYDAIYLDEPHKLFSVTAEGRLHIWNIDGQEVAGVKAHYGPVYSIQSDYVNRHLLTYGVDSKVRLWDVEGELLQEFVFTSPVIGASFIPGKNAFVVASSNRLRSIDFEGNTITDFPDNGGIATLQVSSNGQYMIVGYLDNKARLWRTTGAELLVLDGFTDDIAYAGFTPEEEHVIVYSSNGTASSCPIPDYIYESLEKSPPVLTEELKSKYNID